MKFKSKKINDIIYLDDDFVDIVGVDKQDRFIYEINLWADIVKAIKNDSYSVKVSAYTANPLVSTNALDNDYDSRQIIENLKTRTSLLQSQVRSSRANPIAFKFIDISANVNNSVAGKIKKNSDNPEKYLEIKKQTIAILSSDTPKEYSEKTPNLNISKVEQQQAKDISIRRAAIKSIMSGIDPSAVGEASFPLNDHYSSLQGIDRKFSNLKFREARFSRIKASDSTREVASEIELTQSRANTNVKNNKWSKHLRNMLRAGPTVEPDSLSDVYSKTNTISKSSVVKFSSVKDRMSISKELIANIKDIHFLIELHNQKGEIIDIKHRVINHSEEVSDFFTPTYAPSISTQSLNMGKNVVWIRQNDKIATEVLLYRKILNISSPDISSDYKLLAKIPLTFSDTYYKFLDLVNNSSTCIYRAIAVGPTGKISSIFRNSIVKPIQHRGIKDKKLVEELNHVSIFSQTQGDSVIVRVSNIPTGPIAMYIVADDVTGGRNSSKFSETSSRVVGSEPTEQVKSINSGNNELIFEDKKVQHGHIYEYRAVAIYPHGHKSISKIVEVHEFLKTESKVIVNLTGLATQTDATGNITVTFNIESSFTDTGFETIIGSLESAGADKNFISEIKDDRGRLNGLLAFLVQRQDSVTGETETFGVISNSKFVDDATTRFSAGVSSIKPGRSYRYIVRLLLRSAETMFEMISSDSTDVITNKKFNKKIFKFFNPSILSNGTLPTTNQSYGINLISRLNHEDKFLQGRTGVEVGIDVEIPLQKPSINSVIATRIKSSKNMISWTITGEQDEIDHFIVMAEVHGIKSTVATVHNLLSDGGYYYYDSKVAGELGSIRYSVIPVLSNYEYGSEMYAKEIITLSNNPSFVLEI